MAWEFGAAVVGMFILSVAVRAAYRDAVRLAKSPPWFRSEREASTFRLNTKKKLLF